MENKNAFAEWILTSMGVRFIRNTDVSILRETTLTVLIPFVLTGLNNNRTSGLRDTINVYIHDYEKRVQVFLFISRKNSLHNDFQHFVQSFRDNEFVSIIVYDHDNELLHVGHARAAIALFMDHIMIQLRNPEIKIVISDDRRKLTKNRSTSATRNETISHLIDCIMNGLDATNITNTEVFRNCGNKSYNANTERRMSDMLEKLPSNGVIISPIGSRCNGQRAPKCRKNTSVAQVVFGKLRTFLDIYHWCHQSNIFAPFAPLFEDYAFSRIAYEQLNVKMYAVTFLNRVTDNAIDTLARKPPDTANLSPNSNLALIQAINYTILDMRPLYNRYEMYINMDETITINSQSEGYEAHAKTLCNLGYDSEILRFTTNCLEPLDAAAADASAASAAAPADDAAAPSTAVGWVCSACTLINHESVMACMACNSRKPR